MGFSMVTERYHYVEWRTWDDDRKLAGEIQGRELYDNRTDPEENVNVAGLAENAQLIQQLSAKLASGWKAALPPGAKSSSTGLPAGQPAR